MLVSVPIVLVAKVLGWRPTPEIDSMMTALGMALWSEVSGYVAKLAGCAGR